MKKWRKKYEWMQYAACVSDPRHTGEIEPFGESPIDVPGLILSSGDLDGAARVCEGCNVRTECIKWALEENSCSVVVAGVYLPDPGFRLRLRKARALLRGFLEGDVRGGSPDD